MKKTHLAIVALGAVLLTGYSGCSNTSQGAKADYRSAKEALQEKKQNAKAKAAAAKERAESTVEGAVEGGIEGFEAE